ncbi:MAG: serine protease [Pseudomonadota bacterium]
MTAFLTRVSIVLTLLLMVLSPGQAQAQEQVWVQIEALPTVSEAQDRARAYAAVFPETSGYRLPSGWYALVLGPYPVAEGAAQLNALRRENLIPRDSFIAYGNDFREQFWPMAGQTDPAATPVAPPEAITESPIDPSQPDATPPVAELTAPPEESPAEARRSEAGLSREDRLLLQTALQWFGHYSSTIDGDFGPGTRASMAAWQTAMGLDQTGILTTPQRAMLINAYQAEQAEYGFATVTEVESGIDITLPTAMVEFDRYEPPFVYFRPRNGSDLSVMLISQPGDQATLYGLYDILQTLKIMPLTGERSRSERSFTLRGTSATVDSTAYAELKGGLVKGWILVSTPANAARNARILAAMQGSFTPTGERALDPGMVPMDAAARRGLLAGLEVRRPRLSRSGFYVDAGGAVLTTAEAVQSCGRITIDRAYDADVTLTDAALGLAILTPRVPLSPPVVAGFQTGADRIGAEIAASGYSYEDKLPSPVLNFGTLEEATGLNGEAGVKRLTLAALPGDAGGPVVDGTGAVIGMLRPTVAGTQQLPADVAFATAASALTARLTSAGITPATRPAGGALAPEDLSRLANGMTVLVSCWD